MNDGMVTQEAQDRYGEVGGNRIAKYLRLEIVTYPDGPEINYDYGTTDAIDDIMSRLASIKDDDDSTVLASYEYLGAGRIVRENYAEIQVDLDYAGDTNSFAALDRFGRVTDQVWNDYGADPDEVLDEFTYGYDGLGNRVWEENVGAAEIPATPVHLDELYEYDGLNRLTGVERGNLVDGLSGKEISGTPSFSQEWDLDALGNWGTFDDNGTSQTREVNEANEIAEIDGDDTDVDHDAAGNMTKVPKLDVAGEHFYLVYDAWNRLVKVYDDGGTTLIAEYQYDATGRRVVKGVDDGTDGSLDTFTYYFHSGTQVVETREGDDVSGEAPAAESLEPKYQNIWSARYVDSMILRDECDAQGDIITANRICYLSDVNYNVTALVNASPGNVVERYLYTPYGTVTVLDPDFSVDADGISDYDNTTLYTGREFDAETELMYYRARYYHSELGRFVSRDPIGYGGGINLYAYVGHSPIARMDPSGLKPTPRKVRCRCLGSAFGWPYRTLYTFHVMTKCTGDVAMACRKECRSAGGTYLGFEAVGLRPPSYGGPRPPYYDPNLWNDLTEGRTGLIQLGNNCYSYACNRPYDFNGKPRPIDVTTSMDDDGHAADGLFPGDDWEALKSAGFACEELIKAAKQDGLIVVPGNGKCPSGWHKVQAVVAPGVDYHWYRQDDSGLWSHKPGLKRCSKVDASGDVIRDPAKADHDYTAAGGTNYTETCEPLCAPN